MKIIAFSDLHRGVAAAQAVVDAAHDADVVIGAGDFATAGQGTGETFDVLRSIRCPFIFVHGNHDDPAQLRNQALDWPDAHYLHGQSVTIDGVVFYGMGGETPILNDVPWNTGQSETAAAKLLSACPAGAILVTHAPPFGHCDLQADGRHEGSIAIAASVETQTPSHVLCGHIHNAWGARSRIGPSRIRNLGPKPITFQVGS